MNDSWLPEMITEDEYLERIVAGIQTITTTNAEVTWNDRINGRQFDVVVRFKLGSLRYLVLIEVKNRTRKATASDMEAFVQKARDQNANKIVFVTVAGFQAGAKSVAERHSVDIFQVSFDENRFELPSQGAFVALHSIHSLPTDSISLSFGTPHLVANVTEVTLVYDGGNRVSIPDEQSQMTYYLVKTRLQSGQSLNELIASLDFGITQVGQIGHRKIEVDPSQQIFPPDDYFFPAGPLARLELSAVGRMGRRIQGNVRIDPDTFRPPIIYTNVLTGEALNFAFDQLPLGTKRATVGRYYCMLHPLRYYYCDSIVGDQVQWYLVESFQNAQKVTATLIQDIKYSPHYIPVSDRKVIKRLKRRLNDYLTLVRK